MRTGRGSPCIERFVGRAATRGIYEDGDLCTGFTFGKRKGARITARLYDKLVDIEAKGSDFWFDIWDERFDPSLGVHRLEFEWGREALKSMQLSNPSEVLDMRGIQHTHGGSQALEVASELVVCERPRLDSNQRPSD